MGARKTTFGVIDPASADRRRIVHCDAGTFDVPRHVVRVFSSRTAGWQVRWQASRYFGDNAYGGSARASLDAAIAHLRKVWRPVRKVTRRGKALSNEFAGVSLRKEKRSGRWYVEASHPQRGSPKRFYVGTDATWDEARYRSAVRQAKSARKQMLASSPLPIR